MMCAKNIAKRFAFVLSVGTAMIAAIGCHSGLPPRDTESITAARPATKSHTQPNASAADKENMELYITRVQPILQKSCYRCHGGMNHRGGLNIQTHAGMLIGGHDGTVLVPGDPEDSLLVKLMRHQGPSDDPMPMPPPPRPKVSDEDIATVAKWIKGGALMPD